MTSHFAYVELRLTRSIFAIPLDFEIAKLTCTIAIKSIIFLYDPYFQSNDKFEFWVLFDMNTCILATKFGHVRFVSFTIVHEWVKHNSLRTSQIK